jgi:hypothetical protein
LTFDKRVGRESSNCSVASPLPIVGRLSDQVGRPWCVSLAPARRGPPAAFPRFRTVDVQAPNQPRDLDALAAEAREHGNLMALRGHQDEGLSEAVVVVVDDPDGREAVTRLRIGSEVLVMRTDELRGAIDDLRLGAD